MDQYKKKMMPHVIHYLEEGDEKEVEAQLSGSKLEYYAFVKIVTEMLSQVEGNDSDKLKELLFLDPIFDHYFKLLNSKDNVDRVKACNYYSNTRLVNYKVINKLKDYLNSGNLMLVFSAASALMGSEDVKIRIQALHSVSKQKKISDMALLELFHKFHSGEDDQNELEAEALKSILENPDIPPENRALFISGITEIGYYALVNYLLDRLKDPGSEWDHPEILYALIKAQGEFNNINSVDTIRRYLKHGSPKVIVGAIEELSDYGSDEDTHEFYSLLLHTNNKVRKAAVFALLKNNELESDIVTSVPEAIQKEISKFIMIYKHESRQNG